MVRLSPNHRTLWLPNDDDDDVTHRVGVQTGFAQVKLV